MDKITTSAPQPASDPDSRRRDPRTEAAAWLASRGPAGEWLRAAIDAYRRPPAVAVRLVDGLVFLPHPEMAGRLGKDPAESLRLLDAAGWIETDVLAPMRRIREVDGIRGLLLNRDASRAWQALAAAGGTDPAPADGAATAEPGRRQAEDQDDFARAKASAALQGEPLTGMGAAAAASFLSHQHGETYVVIPHPRHPNMFGVAPRGGTEAPSKEQASDAAGRAATETGSAPDRVRGPRMPPPLGQSQPAPKQRPRDPGRSRTPQGAPSPSLDRKPVAGPADDLVRRIREREALPCPVDESPEWLSVPYTIIDWYVELHPGLTRSRLIVALHRHSETLLEGNDHLKVRKETRS